VCRSFVGIHKKQRAGAFRGVFTHFLLCNRRERILRPRLDRHHRLQPHAARVVELRRPGIRRYLALELAQLRPGGRRVVRDVVGSDGPDDPVQLYCDDDDASLSRAAIE
jgi:hypothetical protein